MKRHFNLALLIIACMAAACAQSAPAAESTPELTAPAPEETAEASAQIWETFVQREPTRPGWVFQHPAGWTIVDVDGRNVFLYSTPGAGDQLFSRGLQPGQIVMQISLNPAAQPGQTTEEHLRILTNAMRDATYGEIEPVSIAGIDGLQRRIAIENVGLSAVGISQVAVQDMFIDIIAYSRSDEFERNLPLLTQIIETVRYTLPTE